jgi:hypothetical protein
MTPGTWFPFGNLQTTYVHTSDIIVHLFFPIAVMYHLTVVHRWSVVGSDIKAYVGLNRLNCHILHRGTTDFSMGSTPWYPQIRDSLPVICAHYRLWTVD